MQELPFRLYVVSDRRRMGADPAGAVALLVQAGLRAFQWREKDLSAAENLDWLCAIREAIRGPVTVGPNLVTGIHPAGGWGITGGSVAGGDIAGGGAAGGAGGGVSYPWQIAPRVSQASPPDPVHHRAPHGGGDPSAPPDGHAPSGATVPLTMGGSVAAAPPLHLFVNDRADLALAARCDLHLAETSIPTAAARALLGPGSLLGRSTHSVESAIAAAREGADFVTFGPVYDTASKRAYGPPQGITRLHSVCAAVAIPVLAIGGVTEERIPECREAGAHGVAVIGAVWDATDPVAATARCLDMLAGP